MERVHFGMFTFTTSTGELRRGDSPVRLQAQPAKVLAALLARPGEIVTRETLQREVWGDGTHVDFERGLNFCIAQVRSALGDSAEGARYIETVPKQGYRFIAPVKWLDGRSALPPEGGTHEIAAEVRGSHQRLPLPPVASAFKRKTYPRMTLVVLGLTVAVVAATIAWGRIRQDPAAVIVVPFYNETGRPELDPLARSLGDAVVASLATPARIEQLSVIGNAPALRNPFARQDVQQIARDLGARWVLIGQLKADGQNLRLIAHLVRAEDMKHVWAQPFDDGTFDLAGQSRVAEAVAASVQGYVRTP